jgi:rod shape-determining protein MreC
MFTVRRWWDKNALKMLGLGVTMAAGYTISQTHSSLVFEIYNNLSAPFQPKIGQMDYLKTAQVEQLQNEIQELKNQNQQLKQLLNFSSAVSNQGILAPVILRGADNWWQQVTIGKGSADGIKVDYVVVGTGGLVGRVVSVTPHTSRILLASDPNSRIGAIVSRTRHMGFIQGTRGNQAVFQFFDKRPNVKKGDVVMTSVVSQLFPAGIAVGRVVDINLDKSPAPEAIVELTAPLAKLEWVTVHPHNPHAPIDNAVNAPKPGTTSKPTGKTQAPAQPQPATANKPPATAKPAAKPQSSTPSN